MIERALAVWRISNMLVEEDGPGRVFHKLRELSGIKYNQDDEIESFNDYTPLHCVYCTSIWVAVALSLAPSWFSRLMALSAGAILIDVVESFIQLYKEKKVE